MTNIGVFPMRGNTQALLMLDGEPALLQIVTRPATTSPGRIKYLYSLALDESKEQFAFIGDHDHELRIESN